MTLGGEGAKGLGMKFNPLVFLLLIFSVFTASVRAQAVAVAQAKNVTLTASADGTAPFTYAWKRGAVALPQGGAVLSLTNVQPGDAGIYTVTITNAYGVATATAELTVGQPPSNAKLTIIEKILAWLRSLKNKGVL